MNPRNIAILAVILVALGGFYYFYAYKESERKSKAEGQARKLWPVEAKDVEEIVFIKDGEKVTLRKEGEDYRLVSPVEAKADQKMVKELVAILLKAEKERTLSEPGADLASFGLEAPKLQVAFKAKGKKEVWVAFGNPNVDQREVFARNPEEKKIFLVPVALEQVADRTAYDLRDKTVLAVAKEKVKKIEIAWQDKPLVVEKGPGDAWRMIEPLATEGGKEEVEGLLSKLSELKAAGYQRDGDPATYGLAHPLYRLKVWEQGKEKPATLAIGSQDKQGRYFALTEDHREFSLLDKKFVEELPREAKDLREKAPLVFEVLKVNRIDFSRGGSQILAEKKEKKWQILKPVNGPALEVRMNAWLWDVRNLRAKEFIDRYPDNLKAFGLDKPQDSLTLWVENEKEPHLLFLGKGTGDAFYLRPEGKRAIYILDRKKAEEAFGRTLDAIRDKRLFPFEQEQVREILLQRGDFQILLKKEKERWEVKLPKDIVVEPMRAWTLYWNLRDVEFEKEVAPKAEELSRYGLDKPIASIEMRDKEGRRLESLKMGMKGDKLYGMLASRPAVYSLEKDILEKIPPSEVEL